MCIIPKGFFMSSALTGKLRLPTNVTEIQKYGFAFTSITSIEYSDYLKTIGDSAFYGDLQLSGIIPVHTYEYIGNKAFFGCSLEQVPELTCIKIGSFAFYMNQ